MKWLYALSLVFFMSQAQAVISQSEVYSMLDQMVKKGTISAGEAEKARMKMKTMNSTEWSALNNLAEKVVASRGPASVGALGPIKESKTGDLDKAQLHQIQDDMKKIIPEQRH